MCNSGADYDKVWCISMNVIRYGLNFRRMCIMRLYLGCYYIFYLSLNVILQGIEISISGAEYIRGYCIKVIQFS